MDRLEPLYIKAQRQGEHRQKELKKLCAIILFFFLLLAVVGYFAPEDEKAMQKDLQPLNKYQRSQIVGRW